MGGAEPARVAQEAMRQAHVRIAPLQTLDELVAACALFDEVWELVPGDVSEVRPSLLRALDHAGHYLVGAYPIGGARAGDMVAASVAFFGEPLGESLHSHITGVLPGRGHGIGAAIKWHQRAWAIDRGLSRVTWTYDPLIARNSYFNVTKLGARPRRYHVDFYGPMDDGPNRGQPTDRVDAVWALNSAEAAEAARAVLDPAGSAPAAGPDVGALRDAGAVVALAADPAGEPVELDRGVGDLVLLEIPSDIEGIRRVDARRALRWRLALRAALAPLLAEGGWRVDGFAKSGWYVMARGGNA